MLLFFIITLDLMTQQRFDEFYLTICKQVGGIQNFVKSFFDFLFRKTDFFYEMDPGDKMGFPPGYSKQMIFGIMEQFQKEHHKKVPPKSLEDYKKKVEVAKAKLQTQKSHQKPAVKADQAKSQLKVGLMGDKKPVEAKKQSEKKELEAIISTYNGGKNEKYSWSQQIRQVQVTIEVDPSITSKQIDVKILSNKISIKRKTGEPIVEGNLVQKINTADSVWKIQKLAGKNFITLNLQKAEEKIWSTVFVGDPEIDTSKVHNTKPLQQFDDQTQGAIRKIMYEQQRKQQGLPTTEEEVQQQALKQAWNAEGSPFKGQPFNPNLINFSGSPPNMQ